MQVSAGWMMRWMSMSRMHVRMMCMTKWMRWMWLMLMSTCRTISSECETILIIWRSLTTSTTVEKVKRFFWLGREENGKKWLQNILTNSMKNIVQIINLNSRRCSLSFLTYVPVRWFATCCRTFETIMPFCFGLRHADIFRSTWTHVSWWMMF